VRLLLVSDMPSLKGTSPHSPLAQGYLERSTYPEASHLQAYAPATAVALRSQSWRGEALVARLERLVPPVPERYDRRLACV
jgi:hypothetical protein